jgi:hypothetical protein
MMGAMIPDVATEATSLIFRVALADLASWQEAAIAFGFVFGILLIGFVLEKLGEDLHE